MIRRTEPMGDDPRGSGVSALDAVNIGLRGVVEAGIVLGLGYWGFHTGSSMVTRWALAVGAPAVVFGIWGAVDFHQCGGWAERLRLAEELVLSAVAALAVYSSGQHSIAVGLAGAVLVHHALVYARGDRLLTPPDGPPSQRNAELILAANDRLHIAEAVRHERGGTAVTLTCAGVISEPARERLQGDVRRHLDAEVRLVRFDLRQAWIDSRGAALILELYEECLATGATVEALTTPATREVFSRLGLPLRFRFDGRHVVRVIPPGD